MKILNYIVYKTPVLFSDGSYLFCNLNNFNKTIYYNMPVFKINIKINFIDKKVRNNINIDQSKLLFLNTIKKLYRNFIILLIVEYISK